MKRGNAFGDVDKSPPIEVRRAWPKLTVDLPAVVAPNTCQRCGTTDLLDTLQRWREHNENDRPTRFIVVLCGPCADLIIKPHPRLYSLIWPMEPIPGCVPICVDCRHRAGNQCTHPSAKANGGPGVMMTVKPPTMAHLNYGRGRGEFRQMFSQWPSSCAQRQVGVDSPDQAPAPG